MDAHKRRKNTPTGLKKMSTTCTGSTAAPFRATEEKKEKRKEYGVLYSESFVGVSWINPRHLCRSLGSQAFTYLRGILPRFGQTNTTPSRKEMQRRLDAEEIFACSVKRGEANRGTLTSGLPKSHFLFSLLCIYICF